MQIWYTNCLQIPKEYNTCKQLHNLQVIKTNKKEFHNHSTRYTTQKIPWLQWHFLILQWPKQKTVKARLNVVTTLWGQHSATGDGEKGVWCKTMTRTQDNYIQCKGSPKWGNSAICFKNIIISLILSNSTNMSMALWAFFAGCDTNGHSNRQLVHSGDGFHDLWLIIITCLSCTCWQQTRSYISLLVF